MLCRLTTTLLVLFASFGEGESSTEPAPPLCRDIAFPIYEKTPHAPPDPPPETTNTTPATTAAVPATTTMKAPTLAPTTPAPTDSPTKSPVIAPVRDPGVCDQTKTGAIVEGWGFAITNDLYDITKTVYGVVNFAEEDVPDCDDTGQNEAFQGAPLKKKNTGECYRVNICHGTAGGGSEGLKWNQITVARSSIKQGHAGFNHNEWTGTKLPDYFPNWTSVPNPNGAGKYYGRLEGCGFISHPCEPVETAVSPPVVTVYDNEFPEETTAATTAATATATSMTNGNSGMVMRRLRA